MNRYEIGVALGSWLASKSELIDKWDASGDEVLHYDVNENVVLICILIADQRPKFILKEK